MAYQNRGQDWDDLGRSIQDIIDNAINSHDFDTLSQQLGTVLGQVIDGGTEAVRKAADSARQSSAPRRYTERSAQNRPAARRPTVDVQSYAAKVAAEREAARQEEQRMAQLYGSATNENAKGIVKTVCGAILSAWSGMSVLAAVLIRGIITGGAVSLGGIVPALVLLAVGLFLLRSGIGTLGKISRFKVYLKTLGKKTYCSIDQLARSVGKPAKFVKKELQKMIDQGYFLEGHLDGEEKNLITSNETYDHYVRTQLQTLETRRREQAEQTVNPQPAKVTPQVQEVLDRGNAYIRQIRACNDAIPGEEMTEKISRMESIVRKIFERAEEHPEIIPDLKKMMDYYLPMTVKLLDAYADMDSQPIQGETIKASKREVETSLDTLNLAFEKLLDSIFKETAMDISSDISVLNTLLAQEGLTDDGLKVQKSNL